MVLLSSGACDPDEPAPTQRDAGAVETRDADTNAGADGGPVDRADASEADAAIGNDAGISGTMDATSPATQDAALPLADGQVPADGSAAPPSDASTDANAVDATSDGMTSAADAGTGPSMKQLVAGRAHACSLDSAISGLLCWGDNQFGQATVPKLNAPSFVAAGGDVTCAIEKTGSVTCWGDNAQHQLAVPSLAGGAKQVAIGDAHVCALSASGEVRCWGDDSAGQLQVPALKDVRAIGAGARHSCALAGDGVHCWGDNSRGQRNVPALSGVEQLAVGGFHNCVIAKGAIQCWGGSVPALLNQIPTVSGPTLIAAGKSHSCVIDRAGARCWGDPAARSLTPRELTWPRQLALGGEGAKAFACARHLQGVTCWGDNSLRQTEYNGYPLHVLYRSESEIQAPPALVWSVLMDLDKYPLWNPYTIAMRSTLKVGDPMIMTVKMSDLITIDPQTENIRVLESGHKVCWGIDTDTPEANSGERCQWLEPLAGGGTHYVTEDLIEGTLNLVVLGLFGSDVKTGFDGVASSLKTRAEALAKP